MTTAPGPVLPMFYDAFSESEGWLRQEGLGGSGRFGPNWKLRNRSKAPLHFRDEERGNVARIHGQASVSPQALREYLLTNGPRVHENGYRESCTGSEHMDIVINILRDML